MILVSSPEKLAVGGSPIIAFELRLCFTDLLEEGLVEGVTEVHARGDELIEDWFDLRDASAILGFLEHVEASDHGNASLERFSSRFTLVNQQCAVLLLGQDNRFPLALVQCGGQLIKESVILDGETPNP